MLWQIEVGSIAAIRNGPYRACSAAYPLGHFVPKGRVWGGSPTSILHGRWPAKMASVSTLALLAVSASPNFTWVHVRFAFQGHFRYNRFNGR